MSYRVSNCDCIEWALVQWQYNVSKQDKIKPTHKEHTNKAAKDIGGSRVFYLNVCILNNVIFSMYDYEMEQQYK